jgi:hypothetical protein
MTGSGEIMLSRLEDGPNEEIYGRLDILDGVTMDLIDDETIIRGPDVYITQIEAADIDQDGIQEYVLAGQVDNELSGPMGISTLMWIDDWQSPYLWPEYQQIDRLGRPLSLTVANMDADLPLEIALGGPVHARVFDVTTEEIEAYYAHIPLAFNNYPAPQPGQFADDFSNPASGWVVSADDIAETGYVGGEYHIRVKENETLVSVLSPAGFGVLDYDLDVDIRQVSGGTMAYGLVLDWIDWSNYALLLLAPEAEEFALFQVINGNLEPILPWSHGSLANGTNHVRVERRGAFISIYLNGILQHQTCICYLNAEPTHVGLTVLTAGGEATAGFDNFLLVEVWPDGEAAVRASKKSVAGSALHVERVGWRPR